MARRLLLPLCAFAMFVGGASARAATPSTSVWADAHTLQVVAGAALTLSREPDGAVLVRDDSGHATIKAAGSCTSVAGAPAAARCSATITKAKVFLDEHAQRVLAQPGVDLLVAVFGSEASDNIDVRGATAAQVTCGGGTDTVQAPPESRIWGNCEQVNGAQRMPRTRLSGTVRGSELDSAPGGWPESAGRGSCT